MNNKTGPSVYIPTDKNIFDALHHKKATTTELRSFLRSKGIITSSIASKEDLIKKICRIPFGYDDYKYITELLENPNRKEKITQSSIQADINAEELQSAIEQVRESMSDLGESLVITKDGDRLIARGTYVDVDFTKTELKQRQRKTCEIEIELGDSGITIRRPASKKAAEISKMIRDRLSQKKSIELTEDCISLEGVQEAGHRTQFFDELTRLIKGFKVIDVIDVNFHHIDAASSTEEIDNDLDNPDDDDDVEKIISSRIVKAALSGEGVLQSEQFSQLHREGFYISKLIWISEDGVVGGDRIELEAEFGDPRNCKDFKYLVRGIFRYNENRGEHNVSKRSASRIELQTYNSLLEKAAREAAEKILSLQAGEESNEEQVA
jgi:hypothetical protein